MKIVLIENQLSLRGTSVSTYNYGKYLQELSGHTCYIAAPANSDLEALPKFKDYFGDRVILYNDLSEIPKVDVAYWIKFGHDDGKLIPGIKNIVHAVFQPDQKHGDKYAAVSQWLGEKYSVPYVPHIVTLPDTQVDYRNLMGLPKDAIIFGRYGGKDSFDDRMVQNVVYNVARNNPNIYFLFMNTDMFCAPLPNIIHVEGTYDEDIKRTFIQTCDAMVYGRSRGESFGLAVAEFLYCNKPVICSINAPERNHIQVMGDKGIYFDTDRELYAILQNFQRPSYDYSKLVECFSPEKVIETFEQVFLN